jgi:hypothetical protein
VFIAKFVLTERERPHNILELVLGRPSKKESKTIAFQKFGRTIRTKTTKTTCVTKVEETYM